MASRFRRCLLLVIIALAAFAIDCRTLKDDQYQSTRFLHAQADIAYYRHDIEDAIDRLEEVSRVAPADAVCYRKLADIYRYFRRNYTKALSYASKSYELDPHEPEIHFVIAKIYEGWKDYERAIRYYQSGLMLNPSLPYQYYHLIALCHLAREDTTQAVISLQKGIDLEPHYSPTNRLLHRILVKQNHYRQALDLWRTDNLVTAKAKTFGSFWEWSQEIEKAVRMIEANPEDTDAYIQLAVAYFSALLYHESFSVLEKILLKNPHFISIKRRWEITGAYIHLMNETEMITDAHYTRVVNGQPNDSLFRQDIWRAFKKMAKFFPELGPPPYRYKERYFNTLRKKIENTFRAAVVVGITDNVFDCHFGHIVGREEKSLSLWEEQGDIHAIYLDYMVSNGFGSWAWQYQTQNGGFSSSENMYTVYSIYPPFLHRAVHDWWLLNDSATRGRYDRSVRWSGVGMSADPFAIYYSPRLRGRMRLKELKEVSETINDRYSDDKKRPFQFIKYLSNKIIESSISNHEGYHALERAHLGENDSVLNPVQMEKHSKLTELYYSPFPFLVLSELMTPDINPDTHGNSAHAQANFQIFEGFAQYIYHHSKQFPSINQNSNIMEQIHKLDKKQIRMIASRLFFEET